MLYLLLIRQKGHNERLVSWRLRLSLTSSLLSYFRLGYVGTYASVFLGHLQSLLLYLARIFLNISMFERVPTHRHHGIVVIPAMIADTNRLNLLLALFSLLMEGSHWLARVSVDFDGPAIDLRQGFYLKVITPLFILAFSRTVRLDATINITVNEVLKVIAAFQNVVHAAFSQIHDKIMYIHV